MTMFLRPDARPPMINLFHVLFYMTDGQSVVPCYALRSALCALEGGDLLSDDEMRSAYERHCARLHWLANVKFEKRRGIPVISEKDIGEGRVA